MPRSYPKSDDELIRPARDGTLRVLKAARDAGVKRVIITSSLGTITHGHRAHTGVFAEADWTDETNFADIAPYQRSKTIAERAAWAWHGAEGRSLELVTVNSSTVIGPVLSPISRFPLTWSKGCLMGPCSRYHVLALLWSTSATSLDCMPLQ
jgi:dihydroflavonol-4-reductase